MGGEKEKPLGVRNMHVRYTEPVNNTGVIGLKGLYALTDHLDSASPADVSPRVRKWNLGGKD